VVVAGPKSDSGVVDETVALAQAAAVYDIGLVRHGFRSRCTSPQSWMTRSASASPAASFSTASSGSGPAAVTTSCSDGPATYAMASQGGSSSGPA